MRIHTPIALLCLIAAPLAAIAGPKCTDEPESKWLTEAQMTAAKADRFEAGKRQGSTEATTAEHCGKHR